MMNRKARRAMKSGTKAATPGPNVIMKCWNEFARKVVPANAPELQVKEMRMAFFAGATALFYELMTTLDPDEEPTNADMRRLAEINREIDAFATSYMVENLPSEGSA